MSESLVDHYIEKSKAFRLHFGLSEEDVDFLLKDKGLTYSRLEARKRTLTLELAEAYPLIYGIDYCDFKRHETIFPEFFELPQTTQDCINNRPEHAVGLKGSKNMASYVIRAIKDYPVGRNFMNVEILKILPPPLNKQTSITWTTGLLKGLVKSTKKYQSYKDETGETKRGKIYTIVKEVSPELLKKALKNIEKE